ncbi:MAG TPA: 3-hydroxyacyl-CoA dehydrogenase family protein [Candidatus Binatia bacterium]|nr:3-hydroxyacyl-CoA dehydrogenase family protein [Candidatus Binatia bacterium]
MSSTTRQVRKVAVLGANGAMGSGGGELFAADGIETIFLARDHEKAREGLERAQTMAKSERLADFIRLGTYEHDLPIAVAEADLIFEALAEDLALKQEFFAAVDRHRRPDSIVATVSSGLSIAAMAEGRSESFQRSFLGIHLFNPPNVITGCEVIPHAGTDAALVDFVVGLLERRLGRKVVLTADLPAFAGNRVGFKVLNEVAQLAEAHGVAFMDTLIGPHTGRAMPPLATVDLVGWDVHRAIVDNLHANTRDEAHDAFALPAYMPKLMASGHLGDKTPNKGGFYRRVRDGKTVEVYVLDPARGEYRAMRDSIVDPPDFVARMKRLNRVGRYREAVGLMLEAKGFEADLLRRVILGYVSYGLNRVGDVVKEARDVDRIMGFGFNWAPPSLLVDLAGTREMIRALERTGLEVPNVLRRVPSGPLFREPHVDVGRFFVG